MKRFLILQLRPEDEVCDNELAAFIRYGGLQAEAVHRLRMDRESLAGLKLDDYSAVIVGGGPYMVSDPEGKKSGEQLRFERELDDLLAAIIARDFPYFGGCYGLGILARHLSGEVSTARYGENVEALDIEITEAGKKDSLLQGLPSSFRAFAGHKESCQAVPPGATLLASSKGCPVHMIRVKNNIYATQFHPELEKEGIAIRIRFYRHKGYFPPEDADRLIELASKELITVPPKILSRFVERYRTAAQQ